MKSPEFTPVGKPDRLIEYWKREKFVVLMIVIFGIGFNGASFLAPVFQGKLLDALVDGDVFANVLGAALWFAGVVLAIQVMRYFKRFYIRRFANKTSAAMRLMIYNNIMFRSAEELDREKTGDLMTKALSDVDLCVEGMRKFTTELFDTGVLMLSYLIAMLSYDVKITCLSCLFIPAAMVLAEKLKTVIYRFSSAYRSKKSEITQMTYDSVDHAMLYRANGLEAHYADRYAGELEDYRVKAVKANLLENSMQPIYNVIAMTGVVLVIYFGGGKVADASWSVGAFSAYLAMFTALAFKASKAAKLFNSVQGSKISWQRIKPYLREYREKKEVLPVRTDETMLAVEDLSFSYLNSDVKIIEHVNFEARDGGIVGITGAVASAKSTLGLALTGLYPYIGSIRIDGRELREYSEEERCAMIAYLGHRPELLSDTIYNNLTLGGGQVTDSVLEDVAFVQDLLDMPEREKTLVGNRGIRLSGGQQSRIALARTLLDKKKIIILDDPFAAVDMKTEEAIIRRLRENYRHSVILLISHRLAIFPAVNQILIMHADKSIEVGTHESLILSSKLYSDIYSLQSTAGEDLDAK